MDYSPWSSKNLINRNWLKKFMQVGIDVKCMFTNFGGCDPSGFRDMVTSQKRPNFPFGAWTSKILINWNRLKNSCKYRSMYCACTPILMAHCFQRNLLIFICNNQKFFSDQSSLLHNVNFNNNNAISVLVESLCTLF